MKALVVLIVLFLVGVPSGMAQQKSNHNQDGCYRWRTQVDPRKERITIEVSTLTDSDVEEAIECLLRLEGQVAKARFYGDTRANYNKADRYRPRKNPQP